VIKKKYYSPALHKTEKKIYSKREKVLLSRYKKDEFV